jgi:MYXO-CTERM domain-containing protein
MIDRLQWWRRLPWPRAVGVTVGALLAALFASLPAAAAPTVFLSNLAFSGNGGSFDAHLSNPGGADQIGGYTVSLHVTPETGATGALTVASVSNPTSSPTFNDAGQNPVLGSGSSGYYTVNDIYNTNPPGYVIGGDNTNLVHVNFTLTGGSTGKFDVALLSATAGNVPGSELDNGVGTPIAGAAFSSTPLVVNTPEPSSAVLAAMAASLLATRRRRRTA